MEKCSQFCWGDILLPSGGIPKKIMIIKNVSIEPAKADRFERRGEASVPLQEVLVLFLHRIPGPVKRLCSCRREIGNNDSSCWFRVVTLLLECCGNVLLAGIYPLQWDRNVRCGGILLVLLVFLNFEKLLSFIKDCGTKQSLLIMSNPC